MEGFNFILTTPYPLHGVCTGVHDDVHIKKKKTIQYFLIHDV